MSTRRNWDSLTPFPASECTPPPRPPPGTKGGAPQSTYIYRAPQCMSPRWNWDSPTTLAARECALPPGPKGGGAHSPAAKGVGESQFRRLEKRLALCLLCGGHTRQGVREWGSPKSDNWRKSLALCLPCACRVLSSSSQFFSCIAKLTSSSSILI
jgi:hypothetical protein